MKVDIPTRFWGAKRTIGGDTNWISIKSPAPLIAFNPETCITTSRRMAQKACDTCKSIDDRVYKLSCRIRN